MKYIVRVEQIVEDLSDVDDRDDLPAGPGGKGSVGYYTVPADNEEEALDFFHRSIPIGCLDDFEISIVEE